MGTRFGAKRRSAEAVFGRRETLGPPVIHRTEPKTPWGVPAAKVARASREHTRCGCTQFEWVAEIGWTHRASSKPGGRKTCWFERALARRKSVAPPDAGRGWREGETVRVCRIPKQSSCAWLVGFGSQVLDTMEGVLGLLPVLLSPAGRSRVL
jgi:hypothetical protein